MAIKGESNVGGVGNAIIRNLLIRHLRLGGGAQTVSPRFLQHSCYIGRCGLRTVYELGVNSSPGGYTQNGRGRGQILNDRRRRRRRTDWRVTRNLRSATLRHY